MFLEWSDIYSVNIKEIDEQHKKLFSLINKIYSSKESAGLDVEKIVEEMMDYSVYHFDTEEKYFKKFEYPEEKAHEEMHLMYKDTVKKFKNDLDNKNDENNILNISNFLKKWWLNHIQTEDMKYSTFFNQKGLY